MGFFSGVFKAVKSVVSAPFKAVAAVGKTVLKGVARYAPALGGIAAMIPGVGTLVGAGLGIMGKVAGKFTGGGGAMAAPQLGQAGAMAYQPQQMYQGYQGPITGPGYGYGPTYGPGGGQTKSKLPMYAAAAAVGLLIMKK